MCREASNRFDCTGIGIAGKDLEARLKQVDKISSPTTRGVENARTGEDAATQQLIEEINSDLSELTLVIREAAPRLFRSTPISCWGRTALLRDRFCRP